jgi:hypothetical protein
MRRSLGDVDGIIHPDGAVERCVVKAARGGASRLDNRGRRGGGRGRGRGGSGEEGGGGSRLAARAKRCGFDGGSSGKETLDAAHQHIEWRTGVPLAGVGRREAPDEAVNEKNAHGLVAQAQAAEGVAAHD